MNAHRSISQRIGGLIAGIAGCLLLIYVIGPWLDSFSAMKPLADFIDQRSINANAYYYTEVAEFSDAEVTIKNTMRFMPK